MEFKRKSFLVTAIVPKGSHHLSALQYYKLVHPS